MVGSETKRMYAVVMKKGLAARSFATGPDQLQYVFCHGFDITE